MDTQIYIDELQRFRPDDEMQGISLQGDDWYGIPTASHGYLVVPKWSKDYDRARKCASSFSYKGRHAVYLEQDCDAGKFINND